MNAQKALQFLAELAINNNRTWFAEHKPLCMEVYAWWGEVVSELQQHIATYDIGVAQQIVDGRSPKIFRVYRDVRRSNGVPYSEHLSAWIPCGGSEDAPGYYVRLKPYGESMIGGGAHSPSKEMLEAVRQEILEDAKPIRKIEKSLKRWGGLDTEGDLKTAPRGYDKQHPDIDLLRHKSYQSHTKLRDIVVCESTHLAGDLGALLRDVRELNGYMVEVIRKQGVA